MENNFCDFLINIGLIDLKTSKNLKQINHEIINAKSEHNFSDCFFISLMHFFNNLTINQKKYMCFNLPLRFLLNIEKEKKQKMGLIILKKELKEKLYKLKYLCAWIRNIKNQKKVISKQQSGGSLINFKISFDEFINRKKKTENKSNYKNNNININLSSSTNNNTINNLKMKKNNSSKFNNYYINKANDIINSKELLTTSDKLELLQLNECTFKPSINTTNNSFRNTKINIDIQSTFDKLYKDSEKYRIKKNLKAMEYEHIINKDLTFKPNLCQTPKSISNLKFEKFEIRQQNFINNKKNNTNKLKKNIERNAERKCSFSPKINKIIDFTGISLNDNNITSEENKNINTNNNCDSYYSISTVKTIPVHVRLYDDSKRRNSSYIQKEKEYKNLIDEMASRTSKRFSKINYDKLNNLYENKEKKLILEKTKRKVEEEEGITFKPDINLNNKYTKRIFNNFYERNKNNKKNIIFKNYEKFDGDTKKEQKFTEDEKKEIVKNIVKRLYNEPMEQNILKNKSQCNKYIQNNNLIDSSRMNIENQN
jgi:hypothetical protein